MSLCKKSRHEFVAPLWPNLAFEQSSEIAFWGVSVFFESLLVCPDRYPNHKPPKLVDKTLCHVLSHKFENRIQKSNAVP